MTEVEWFACEQFGDEMSSAAIASPQWSFRKETLFCAACCRRVLAVLPDERGAQLLDEFEAAALGPTMNPAVDYTRPLARYVAHALADPRTTADERSLIALGTVARGYISQAAESCAFALAKQTHPPQPSQEEMRIQAAMIRDIVGNPFRPVAFQPQWRTDTVVALARQIDASRDFSAVPILADALQDAGCDNADILTHCRAPVLHVRGCWVVDLVLGNE
jgi:hypothetical protein